MMETLILEPIVAQAGGGGVSVRQALGMILGLLVLISVIFAIVKFISGAMKYNANKPEEAKGDFVAGALIALGSVTGTALVVGILGAEAEITPDFSPW